MGKGDAWHTAAQQAPRGMERHGGGQRLQCRLPSRLLSFLQGNGMPVHSDYARCGAHGQSC